MMNLERFLQLCKLLWSHKRDAAVYAMKYTNYTCLLEIWSLKPSSNPGMDDQPIVNQPRLFPFQSQTTFTVNGALTQTSPPLSVGNVIYIETPVFHVFLPDVCKDLVQKAVLVCCIILSLRCNIVHVSQFMKLWVSFHFMFKYHWTKT